MIFQRHLKIIAAIILAICVGFVIAWGIFIRSPLILNDHGLKFKVFPGSSFKTIAADLHSQGILKHPLFFTLLFRWRGDTHHLKAGEYLFPKGATPNSMIEQMVTGRGMVNHSFIIVPGQTFYQVRQTLNKDEALQHSTKDLSNAAIMKLLGRPGLAPEGVFFPDTYYFMEGSTDIAVLRRSYMAMQKKLNAAWSHRAQKLPFRNAYEALIAASIIVKEADISEELPIIAGVLTNRLRRDIKLQFDPTVIYGLGSRFDGTIYRRDLLADTPYNTYVHKGLPPTPISMPSMDAIDAVMHPDANNYLYFVARGDGMTHQFSRTLADHNAAVAASKKFHPWFFNGALIKSYLRKIFTKTIFN